MPEYPDQSDKNPSVIDCIAAKHTELYV